MNREALKTVTAYLIALTVGVVVNVGIWGLILRIYLQHQAETNERLEMIEDRLTTSSSVVVPKMTITASPSTCTQSQYVQGSSAGACNRPIDESKLRIAPAKETRSELAEMLDRQTEKVILGLDTKSQLIPSISRSDRHE